MFDPDTGADYAARFLQSLYAERGNWSAAAGAYHSQTPSRASVYRARFDRIIAGLGGAPLTVAAAGPEAAPEPAAEPAKPRKSRTRLSRGPKIITVTPQPDRTPAPTESAGGPDAAVDGGPDAGPANKCLLVNSGSSRREYWSYKTRASRGATG